MANKSKILVSTDIGSDVDDALALNVMLKHSGFNVEGIYTVNGDVNSRALIARHMVSLNRSLLYRSLDFLEKKQGRGYKARRFLQSSRLKKEP